MTHWIPQLAGGLLVGVTLADLYLTVLYARSGTGIVAPYVCSGTWRAFCLLSRAFPRGRDAILSYCGPTLLVALAMTWIGGLWIGGGLILWPALGKAVVAAEGPTPTDFVTALYVSGYYMTTVGNGDLKPITSFYRLLLVVESIVGMSMITLVLTYFVQVYTALQRRSTFGLKLHKATGGTGDAAELLAGLGAAGNFDDARGALAVIADELLQVYESYHFYESLIHFRFREPHYSLARSALLVMDTATLLRTALDPESYAFVIESMPARKLWLGGMHALTELSRAFLPPVGEPVRGRPPDAAAADRWRRRYAAAVARLRAAGIHTRGDERAGADAYVALRSEWDQPIVAFSRYLRYTPQETDPAGTRPP